VVDSIATNRLPAPSHLLYDWDNTLVDAWAGVAGALNAVFDAFDRPLWTIEETRARVRLSLREAFPIMFGDDWQRARDIFYAALARDHLLHLRPLEGASEALVAGSQWPVGVVSNKTGRFLRAEIAHLGWAPFFAAVVGAGDASADKPDAAPILLALDRMGGGSGPSVWYIGDTALDVATARAAGVTAVLIGDGAHDEGRETGCADWNFPTARALAGTLKLLSGRSGTLAR
jgi:phosphoglycolate phosphatase